MSLHTHFFKETRSLILTSASGLFLFSQALPAQTPEHALPEVSTSATRTYEEPALLPTTGVKGHSLFSVSEGRVFQVQHVQAGTTDQRLNRLYGNQSSASTGTVQPVRVQPVLQTPPATVQQTAGSRVPRRSLFDRLVGKIKGDTSAPAAAPPQDPGMSYTTVTEAKLQKTQAPQLVQQPQSIPPIEKFTPPPVPGIGEADMLTPNNSSTQPVTGLPKSFPAIAPVPVQQSEETKTSVANSTLAPSFPDTFIPPLPGSDEYTSLPQGQAQESFPELKAIMEGDATTSAPKQVASVQPSPAIPVVKSKPKTRPLLDLSGPLPLLEEVLEAEKVEELVAETPTAPMLEIAPEAKLLEVPAPEIAELQIDEAEVIAPPMPAIADSNIDPLANPFPEDTASVAGNDDLNAKLLEVNPFEDTPTEEASIAKAPAMPDTEEVEVSEVPYSGLSLEDDLFLKGKVPAPAEPSSIIGSNSSAPVLTDENSGFATLDDNSMPELPPFPSIEEEQEVVIDEPTLRSQALTPSKEFPQLQTPQSEQRVAMSTPEQSAPELRIQVEVQPKQEVKLSKMELIASRKGLTGLKGFCPVQLRDTRDLVDVNENYSAIFNNKKYSFSNAAALQKFIGDPEKYAPAIHGSDVIHLSLTGEELEGSLDYAVWFKGRLYLFSSAETMETFVAAPNSHVTNL
ncbi:hypothetical protein OAF42_03460 [Planctomicrobium sp.]|nr:hypothetical protein [Planctomicrobium sp.]MBT5017480.1 hypothetical protein [Planctomicrobium sp.]MDB4733481.1 hypothetical protein [Planctomicrobium sp.]